MARLVGLEPTTLASAGLRSIHLSYRRSWCRRWDLNPHARIGHYALNVARLPFRHFGRFPIFCLPVPLKAGTGGDVNTLELLTSWL